MRKIKCVMEGFRVSTCSIEVKSLASQVAASYGLHEHCFESVSNI